MPDRLAFVVILVVSFAGWMSPTGAWLLMILAVGFGTAILTLLSSLKLIEIYDALRVRGERDVMWLSIGQSAMTALIAMLTAWLLGRGIAWCFTS